MGIKLALAASGLSILLAGCGGNLLETEYIRQTNQRLERLDAAHSPVITTDVAALEDLWKDKPQYLPLIHAQSPVKRIRLISGVFPRYPYMASAPNIKRTVQVSFVVAPNGKVEAARVLSSDGQFLDNYAIEATMMFRFAPAEAQSGPVRAMSTMPFDFQPRKSTPLSACCAPPRFPPDHP